MGASCQTSNVKVLADHAGMTIWFVQLSNTPRWIQTLLSSCWSAYITLTTWSTPVLLMILDSTCVE